jgi:hypothetical protein
MYHASARNKCTKNKLPLQITKEVKIINSIVFSSMGTHHCTQAQGTAMQVSHVSSSVHSVECPTKTRYEN